MSGGKIFAVAISVIVLLIGLGLIAGGGALLWSNTFLRDSEGYYSTRTINIERDSYGVTTYPARIEYGPAWLFDWPQLVKVKLEATSNTDSGVFVGVAEEGYLFNYLDGVAYDEISDLDINRPFRPPRIHYRDFPGGPLESPPGEEGFWAASVSGKGTQVLTWGVEEGRYSLVLMNQDGSRGIDIDGTIGVKVPLIGGIGIGLFIAGLVLVLFSFLLVFRI